jgi:hypothetical protein
MNPKKYTLPIFLVLATAITSCYNDGDIGDLYGRWQLQEYVVADSIVRPNNLFLSFQNKTVQAQVLYSSAHVTATATGSYQQTADSLCMEFILLNDDYENLSLHPLFDKYFKFDTTQALHFHLDKLNRSELWISQGNDYWHFRSY